MLLKLIKTRTGSFLCLLIVASLIFSAVSFSAFALTEGERAEYKKKIESIKSDIEANNKKIEDLKKQAASHDGEISSLQDEIDALEGQIDLYNNEISLIQDDIDDVDSQITGIENEIEALNKQIQKLDDEVADIQQQIADTYTLLGERIRASYMSGSNSALEYLLTADDFEYQSYLERIELLDRITKHDDALVKGLRDDIESLKQKVAEIEEVKVQKASKIEELEKMKQSLEAKKKEQQDAKNKIQKTEDEIQAELDKVLNLVASLKASSKECEEAIDRGEDAIREYEEKLAAQEQQSGGGSGQISGDMIWPLPYGNTYVSSSYKMRTLNGVTRQHNGIDICRWGGTSGASIVAVKEGTVEVAYHSGYNGGYGLYVVINHGNGVKTYYAHMSAVYVNVGDYVTQGTQLGCAGNTGYSFGAHLHFGLMINGSWVNPMNYLSRPAGVSIEG